MNLAKRSSGIYKKGASQSQGNVVIGGIDQELVNAKKNLLEEMIETAEAKAASNIKKLTLLANKEAEALIREAKEQATAIEAKAFEQGYKAGEKQATQDCDEELKSILTETATILKTIEKEREEALADEEARIYKLITIIAHTILDKELEISEETCLKFISKAIKELEHKANINLITNPRIAKKLNHLKPELMKENPEIEQLTISTDSNFGNGDLILESNKDRLDHRLASKLELMLEEMLKQ